MGKYKETSITGIVRAHRMTCKRAGINEKNIRTKKTKKRPQIKFLQVVKKDNRDGEGFVTKPDFRDSKFPILFIPILFPSLVHSKFEVYLCIQIFFCCFLVESRKPLPIFLN